MLARGIQANLTGSRADVVICDDVEVPNTCDTALKRADLRGRLAEVDCVLTPGGLQLYVGTPHTWYSIYAETARAETGETAPFLDGFRRLVIPLVGPDGAGVPAGAGSVIAAVYADAEGRCFLHPIAWLNGGAGTAAGMPDEPDEATRQCRAVAAFVRDLHLPAVSIEINGLGRFLPGLLQRALRRAGVAAAVLEIASRKPKDQRILEAFDTRLAAGMLYAHHTVWATPFVTELREWQPGGLARGHDDGLDAVAGCLLAEPVRLGRGMAAERGRDWRPGGGSVRAETEFESERIGRNNTTGEGISLHLSSLSTVHIYINIRLGRSTVCMRWRPGHAAVSS